MPLLDIIPEALARLGLSRITPHSEGVLARTNLITFEATADPTGSLRLECRMVEGVLRNKVSLWNIVHHNNNFYPFGQFYISPTHSVAFGLWLEANFPYGDWLERILFEIIHVAESYYKIIYNDFIDFPFDEHDVSANFLLLERTQLQFETRPSLIDQTAAAYMLERMLEDHLGARHVVRMGEAEFAVADESITHITLEKMPYLRRHHHTADWFIGLRTEVGVVEGLDNPLWVLINRLNYEGCMLACAIKYTHKRAILTLTSELPADCIQHPAMLQNLLQRHNAQADWLFRTLGKPYRMQSMVDFNLGF